MNSRLKHLILIIAIEFACVGAGLWIQHQFVHSLANRTAKNMLWGQLQLASSQVLDDVDGFDPNQVNLGKLRNRLQQTAPGQPWELSIVDKDWGYLRGTQTEATPGELSQTTNWEPKRGAGSDENRFVRGTLSFPDGEHSAMAIPLAGAKGFLVVHVPVASIRTTTNAVLDDLPLSSGISFAWTCTLLGVLTYLIGSRINELFSKSDKLRDTDSLKKSQALIRTQDAVIFGLAKLAESRDPDTGLHLERISMYATELAQAMRHHPKFRDTINTEFVKTIGLSSALHDIGKVGIQDTILLKPGVLNKSERAEIQKHAAIGAECLLKIEQRLGSSNFLQMARSIARSHHERWDGSGYPDNKLGREIPLAARIVSVADVYDALATRRVYKPSLPHIACVGFIQRGAGTQFDQDIVEVFLEVEQQFRCIAEQNSEPYIDNGKRTQEEFRPDEFVDVELDESILDESILDAAKLDLTPKS